MNNKNSGSALVAGLMLFVLAGCSTLEYVPIDRSKPQDLRSQLAVGETVKVRLYDGARHQFRIVALEADAIVGRDQRVAYQDIDLLEVETRDVGATTKTALALGALVLVYVASAALDSELEEEPRTEDRCSGDGTVCVPR